MESFKDIQELLRNPPREHRSVPFWAWNDRLEGEELKRQIADMKARGMGGLFLHSREGLETEYLSHEWMEAVETSVKEGKKEDLEIWVYDEDKWPSGCAGGLVAESDPEAYAAKGLTAELQEIPAENLSRLIDSQGEEPGKSFLYILEYDTKDPSRLEPFRIVEEQLPPLPPGSTLNILILRVETSGTSEWYNGSTPTDNLNPGAVGKFLELTHRQYEKRFGQEFGRGIQGFFTDEPNFCDFFSSFTEGRPWLPWSTVLEDFFRQKRGRSIRDILPLLFFKGPGYAEARYDFWHTLTELFLSSYTKQIYQWCEDRNLQLTGHMLFENDMGYSARVSGSPMPHYRYMHAPGIDILANQTEEYLTVKQCTSVANQFRRKTVITETYGCTGWELRFADQKALGDWQYVMGVNRRCQHLALYSLTGCRKRDYPPSFNYHNSWWSHQQLLEDYFARLSVCVSEGTVSREILCLHPMGDVWMESGSSMTENLKHIEMNMGWLEPSILEQNRKGDRLNQLIRLLLENQYDFDFGDEWLLKNEGSVREGHIRVGSHLYSTVIVPSMKTIMGSTLALLEQFLDQGGTVLWLKPFTQRVDARDSTTLELLLNRENLVLLEGLPELFERLDKSIVRPLRITDQGGRDVSSFLSMTRKVKNGSVVTIVHREKDRSARVRLCFAFSGKITSFDPWQNEEKNLEPGGFDNRGGMYLDASFAPLETRVYFIDESKQPNPAEPAPPYLHPHSTEPMIMGFPLKIGVSLPMENALVLDVCRFTTGEDPWSEESPLWMGQRELRKKLGLNPVYYNGAPQRYKWIDKQIEAGTPLALEFPFFVETIPDGEVYAAVEKSDRFQVFCNGRKCSLQEDFFLDRSILKHRIPELQRGWNSLEIQLDYFRSTELENIYITGEFGVTPDRGISVFSGELRRGDWCAQGLFHYPGSVVYRFDFPAPGREWDNREIFFRLGDFKGTLAVLRLNGEELAPVLIGDQIISLGKGRGLKKENRVEVEILGSLRNLMGPFHRKYNSCSRISWEDFRTEGALYTPEYSVEPYGLMGECALVAKIVYTS